MQGQPAAHRVAHQVGAIDAEVIPQHLEVGGAGVHAARSARFHARLAMAAQVRCKPFVALGHGRDDLSPAAPTLGEAMQEGDGRAFTFHEIVEAHVGALQNRHY
jgi:hypothetical protein